MEADDGAAIVMHGGKSREGYIAVATSDECAVGGKVGESEGLWVVCGWSSEGWKSRVTRLEMVKRLGPGATGGRAGLQNTPKSPSHAQPGQNTVLSASGCLCAVYY